jgi:hypothetical protein
MGKSRLFINREDALDQRAPSQRSKALPFVAKQGQRLLVAVDFDDLADVFLNHGDRKLHVSSSPGVMGAMKMGKNGYRAGSG